ncbi:MAG: GntR family transcriptional regulator [Variibacter sp.]
MSSTPAVAPRLIAKGLQHRTIAAAVVDALRRRILDGKFSAGAQLRQDSLAQEFGVSRIPIREALLQLDAEGLVKILPHRGAVVSALSAAEVTELFALRALLEPRLLRLSAPHLTAADYAELDRILEEYSSALRAHQVDRWGELNTAFHAALYKHAGQPRTAGIVAALLQNCDRYTRLQLSYTKGRRRAQTEHAELVRLCRQGDIEGAAALLKTHVENVGDSLATFIEKRVGTTGA